MPVVLLECLVVFICMRALYALVKLVRILPSASRSARATLERLHKSQVG